MKDLDIYEMEYSASPGGVDKWEIQEREGEFFQGDFDSAEEAISFALYKFDGQELNLNVKSLEWNNKQEGKKTKQEWKGSIENVGEDALMAFWEVVANAYPEAETGDFDIALRIEMGMKVEEYISHWLNYNHPTYREDNE